MKLDSTTKTYIGYFIIVASYIIGAIGTLIAIGYCLYLWGPNETPFNMALWTAFKGWLWVIGTAFLGYVSGLILIIKQI